MTPTFEPDNDFTRIAEVSAALGVPCDDWVLLWRWADELPEAKAVDEFTAYVEVLIADRCWRPGDDLVTRLIRLGLTASEITRVLAILVAHADVGPAPVPRRKISRCRPSRA